MLTLWILLISSLLAIDDDDLDHLFHPDIWVDREDGIEDLDFFKSQSDVPLVVHQDYLDLLSDNYSPNHKHLTKYHPMDSSNLAKEIYVSAQDLNIHSTKNQLFNSIQRFVQHFPLSAPIMNAFWIQNHDLLDLVDSTEEFQRKLMQRLLDERKKDSILNAQKAIKFSLYPFIELLPSFYYGNQQMFANTQSSVYKELKKQLKKDPMMKSHFGKNALDLKSLSRLLSFEKTIEHLTLLLPTYLKKKESFDFMRNYYYLRVHSFLSNLPSDVLEMRIETELLNLPISDRYDFLMMSRKAKEFLKLPLEDFQDPNLVRFLNIVNSKKKIYNDAFEALNLEFKDFLKTYPQLRDYYAANAKNRNDVVKLMKELQSKQMIPNFAKTRFLLPRQKGLQTRIKTDLKWLLQYP